MKSYSDEITARYHVSGVWDDVTWNDYVAAHATEKPDAPALVDQPNKADLMGVAPARLTWGEVRSRVDGLAVSLLDAGVRSGDVVFVQLPNCVELVLLHLALDRMGAIGTFAPMRHRSSEVKYAVNKTQARVAVCMGSYVGHNYLGMVDRMRAECPTLQQVIAFQGSESGGADAELSDLIRDVDPDRRGELDALRPSPDDVLTLCLTTGTESTPKVVPRTPNSWKVVTRAIVEVTHVDGNSVFSGAFPYANMGGLGVQLYPWVMAGGTFVVHDPFDVDVFLRQITEEKVNYIIAVPAIFFAMLGHPELDKSYDISSFTVVGCGGEAPPHTIIEALDARGIRVINEFGATEGWAFFTLPEQPLAERKDLFRIDAILERMPETEFKALRPDSGDEVEAGTPGELAVRGPSVFAGYLDADDVNARSFTSEGFFRTGDLVQIGTDRTLRYVGRLKDMIIRSGQNISPAEIEFIVQRHPSVYEVSVIGVPDPLRGQLVCACVALRPGTELTLAELQEFMRDRDIASYKIPERLEIVSDLPKGPSGKILKRALRDQFDVAPSGA